MTLLSTGNITSRAATNFVCRLTTALQHILDQPRLKGRQMRLLETLQEYDFDIEYYPGARNCCGRFCAAATG